jgi:hypothetical protein
MDRRRMEILTNADLGVDAYTHLERGAGGAVKQTTSSTLVVWPIWLLMCAGAHDRQAERARWKASRFGLGVVLASML